VKPRTAEWQCPKCYTVVTAKDGIALVSATRKHIEAHETKAVLDALTSCDASYCPAKSRSPKVHSTNSDLSAYDRTFLRGISACWDGPPAAKLDPDEDNNE